MTSDQQTLMKFSDIAMYMQPSAIRRLLKVTETPDLISFGGGLPNPESFPIKEIKEIFNELIETNGKKMLQYGATEGLTSLNLAISKMLKERENIVISKDELIQTTGSQEALYMIGKILANPNDMFSLRLQLIPEQFLHLKQISLDDRHKYGYDG
jgi:Transcriptional regulators containing a DNA-binding HTH domain and an aminotransferase domain (MocR family) and their eukaryotic orthologs